MDNVDRLAFLAVILYGQNGGSVDHALDEAQAIIDGATVKILVDRKLEDAPVDFTAFRPEVKP